jgi:hypothetical protein
VLIDCDALVGERHNPRELKPKGLVDKVTILKAVGINDQLNGFGVALEIETGNNDGGTAA